MADSPLEEDRFELPVPPKTPGILAVVLSRSRRLSLAEKPLPESARRPTKVRNRCAADVETIRRNSALRRFGSLPSRGRRFADVRRMHQAGWFVKHISDELEFELFQDFLRSTIVRVMPSVDLRQSQFFPGVFERAERCFRCGALAPAALHEMEPDFEIRLAGRIEPRPKSAAADELAIAVIEQRPILNVPLDLGAELLSDLGLGEFAAGINERRDDGIAPQFHRKGQILDLP